MYLLYIDFLLSGFFRFAASLYVKLHILLFLRRARPVSFKGKNRFFTKIINLYKLQVTKLTNEVMQNSEKEEVTCYFATMR